MFNEIKSMKEKYKINGIEEFLSVIDKIKYIITILKNENTTEVILHLYNFIKENVSSKIYNHLLFCISF